MQNIIIISLIICVLYINFLKQKNEKFTQDEMKKYSKMLKINCNKNTKLYKDLLTLNKQKCNKNGKYNRETINNSTSCYDNIGKEIVSKFDMESNCVMANILNKSDKKLNQIIENQAIIKPKLDPSIIEGPDFINQWGILTYDTKKAGNFSDINLDKPYIFSNSLAQI